MSTLPKLKPLSLEEWRIKIDGLERDKARREKARAAKLRTQKSKKEK
jgi:hypothetical protein